MGFYQPQGVYILENYDELSESVAFAQNCGLIQTKMDQFEKDFWLFSYTKNKCYKQLERKK